jgi:hypothetical protein
MLKSKSLKRERCTSKMELSLIISMTVIIRVKHSSMYSNICVVHREEGIDRPLNLSHPSVTEKLWKKMIPWFKPEGRTDWRSFRAPPLSSQHYVPTSLNHVCLSPWTMTQNLKERILKLRKSARPSGPKAVKANFFTASECLRSNDLHGSPLR